MAHEHRAISAVNIPPVGHTFRRTGVEQLETCGCGMTRHVWITAFKVEPVAWQAPEGVDLELERFDGPANDMKG